MRRLAFILCLWLAPFTVAAQDLSRQEMIQVQGLLSDMGFPMSVDGAMGPGTARGIRAFEAERGLPVTGVPSQRLLGQLQALHAEGWYRTGGAAAQARPSFDCTRAGHPAEFAICADASLAFLDRQLADAYAAARSRATSGGRTALASAQKAWIADRNRCGGEVTCLRFAMEARIAQLR